MSNYSATINGTTLTDAAQVKAAGYKGPHRPYYVGPVPGSGRLSVTLGKTEKVWLGAWVSSDRGLYGQVWSLGSPGRRDTVHVVYTDSAGRNQIAADVWTGELRILSGARQPDLFDQAA